MPPYEFKTFAKQVVGAATFLSNFLLLKDHGYFDVSSYEKWLLHTWSLSVEWQFYIIYPIILVALSRLFPLGYLRWIILFFTGVSFLLSAFSPLEMAKASFYLLPTRAWEMMAGGLLYLFAFSPSKSKSLTLELVGLALIILSTLFLTVSVKWPGSLALIPVLGTALIIIAARGDSPITGSKLAQYLGVISYSLYLWHWPVVVTLNLLGVFDNPWWILFGLVSSLLLAHLSYTCVEKYKGPWPLQFNNSLLRLGSYAGAVLVVCSAAFAVFRLDGVPSRVDNFVMVADQEQKHRNPRSECAVLPSTDPTSPMCIYGTSQSKIAVIVIGDSHSNATITAVADAIPPDAGGALFLGADGCISMLNLSTPYFLTCGDYNKKILSYLNDNYLGTPVIIINHITEKLLDPLHKDIYKTMYLDGKPNTGNEFTPQFIEQYTQHICEISKKRPVFIMNPIPDMGVNVPQAIIRAKMYKSIELDVSISREHYEQENNRIRKFLNHTAEVCNVKIIDPIDYLCDESKCFGSIKHRPLYYDDNHLSEYGNKLLTPMFKKIWDQHSI